MTVRICQMMLTICEPFIKDADLLELFYMRILSLNSTPPIVSLSEKIKFELHNRLANQFPSNALSYAGRFGSTHL